MRMHGRAISVSFKEPNGLTFQAFSKLFFTFGTYLPSTMLPIVCLRTSAFLHAIYLPQSLTLNKINSLN